jgi:hypothetical protein
MICPQCNKTELEGRQKYCSSSCRMKSSRINRGQSPETPEPLPVPQNEPEETYQQRLERRIKETGSKSAIIIKVGYPPENAPAVQVPSRYESEDLDNAILEVRKRQKVTNAT